MAWHARLMTLGWGIIAPTAVLIARFLKVLPGQDFPRVVDNQFWWRSHWMGQTLVLGLTCLAFGLILTVRSGQIGLHGLLGYAVIFLMAMQVLMGIFRGSKGGPTDATLRGDHYDMTRWRLMFEHAHKTFGYLTLAAAAVAIIAGLWLSNAPRWMWLFILCWWLLLIAAFVILQKRGWAIDTYVAIWGNDPKHPGNRRPAPGWGMRRPETIEAAREQPGE